MARAKKPIRPKPQMRALPITDKATELFAKCMPIGDGARPNSINASFYPCGDFRRILVTYPNGWCMRLNFNIKGDITSTSASFRMVAMNGKSGTAVIDEAAQFEKVEAA